MAFETTPFGAIAAPGLAFPFVTHSIETGILQEDKDSEGGFALWAKKGVPGEAGKVYVNQPAGSEAVARVLELEPVMTTASTGTVSVKERKRLHRRSKRNQAHDNGKDSWRGSQRRRVQRRI